jgi:hypothetical protein
VVVMMMMRNGGDYDGEVGPRASASSAAVNSAVTTTLPT